MASIGFLTTSKQYSMSRNAVTLKAHSLIWIMNHDFGRLAQSLHMNDQTHANISNTTSSGGSFQLKLEPNRKNFQRPKASDPLLTTPSWRSSSGSSNLADRKDQTAWISIKLQPHRLQLNVHQSRSEKKLPAKIQRNASRLGNKEL